MCSAIFLYHGCMIEDCCTQIRSSGDGRSGNTPKIRAKGTIYPNTPMIWTQQKGPLRYLCSAYGHSSCFAGINITRMGQDQSQGLFLFSLPLWFKKRIKNAFKLGLLCRIK